MKSIISEQAFYSGVQIECQGHNISGIFDLLNNFRVEFPGFFDNPLDPASIGIFEDAIKKILHRLSEIKKSANFASRKTQLQTYCEYLESCAEEKIYQKSIGQILNKLTDIFKTEFKKGIDFEALGKCKKQGNQSKPTLTDELLANPQNLSCGQGTRTVTSSVSSHLSAPLRFNTLISKNILSENVTQETLDREGSRIVKHGERNAINYETNMPPCWNLPSLKGTSVVENSTEATSRTRSEILSGLSSAPLQDQYN